jgi:hypothetical protein
LTFERGDAVSTPLDDPIEVLIAHAQSLGDAWSRYAALSQTLYPGQPVAEMARKRVATETGEHIIGPDHRMFEIELAIIEDFRRACATRRYLAAGRAAGSLTETPLPADLYQNARLRIVRGELLLYPPRPPRPIKIVRVSAVLTRTMRLSPEWDLMVDEQGNIAMLSGDATIKQDAECARRQSEDEASQVAAAVAAIEARRRDMETLEERPALGWRREKRRRQWINRFRERQRVERKWIEFREIATWCAQSSTAVSAKDEQQAFDLSCQRFAEAVLQGEFEADARSRVLYLDPKSFSTLTRDALAIACRATTQFDQHFQLTRSGEAFLLPINVLTHCWVPADMARDWLQVRGYRLPPYLERPQAASEVVENRDASKWSPTPELRLAIRKAISALGRPPGNPRWEVFCNRVRLEGKATGMRPYTDRHIRRAFKAIEADWTKTN